MVSVISNGVQVRGHLSSSLASVAINDVRVVHGQHLVRVDSDTKQTRVGINHENFISRFQVIQNRSFVQKRHISHIFNLIKLHRITLFIKEIFFLHLDDLTVRSFNVAHTIGGFSQPTFDISKTVRGLLGAPPPPMMDMSKVG
jgi:hypothetical protein